MVAEANIPVNYHKKFVRVLEETEEDVTFEFADGTTETTNCLVGADGIHSRVQKYLCPELEPSFTDVVAVTAAVPTSRLQIPSGYDLPVTILNRTHGAFVIAPQLADGSEGLIGRQKRAQQLSRKEWDELLSNKKWCVDFLRQGADSFPALVQRAVAEITTDKISLWPFYVVPKLGTWSSSHCRAVILGDAAHAIPPFCWAGD